MRAVFRPVEANAVTFVALYVLGVVTAWLTVPNTPSGKLYDNLYLELFLDLYLLCVVLYLFGARGATTRPSNKKRKGWRWASVIKFLVCFVLYAVALADVYCFEKYGSSLTPSMLMLVGETDSREAGEFLSSVLQWDTLTSGVGWLLLIALGHGIASRLTTSRPTPSRPTPLPLPVREGSDYSSPSLVIFHLLGQHMNYYSRYPKKQTHFTADDYQEYRPKMPAHRKKQLVWYDNATLYNDSIVDQIIRRFEQQDAIVIYMPDHGEEVFEPGRLVICRNHTDDIDYPLAHYEYEVPFWVWCSKKYIAARPELFRQIRAAKDRPMMTDALPHMLMYLAGIHSKDYHPEYNILSEKYEEQRPRLLKGIVNYDTLTHDMSSKRSAKIPRR